MAAFVPFEEDSASHFQLSLTALRNEVCYLSGGVLVDSRD